jgi:cytidylate kinase
MSDMTLIAIDGPAGSGKSTLGAALAARLGLATLDTGATYRAVAALALREGIEPDDQARVAAVARSASLVLEGSVVINGIDVTQEIRTPAVNTAVSLVAANPEVRASLVELQRRWAAEHGGGGVEGRDIGSVVFPDATVKLYLTASEEERARRRAEEGSDSIARRDRLDSTRAASPLRQADGAIAIDTTARSVEETVELVLDEIERVTGERP